MTINARVSQVGRAVLESESPDVKVSQAGRAALVSNSNANVRAYQVGRATLFLYNPNVKARVLQLGRAILYYPTEEPSRFFIPPQVCVNTF